MKLHVRKEGEVITVLAVMNEWGVGRGVVELKVGDCTGEIFSSEGSPRSVNSACENSVRTFESAKKLFRGITFTDVELSW